MLNYKTLRLKPTYTPGTSEEMYDLLTKSVTTYDENALVGAGMVYINEYYTCRPDLVSLAVYGSDEYADILCRVNGLSCPFELNEGMVVYVPYMGILDTYHTGYEKSSCDLITTSSTVVGTEDASVGVSSKSTTSPARSSSSPTTSDLNYIINKELNLVIY